VNSQTAPRQESSIFRGHIKELDGIRAAGLVLVLVDHFWPQSLSRVVSELGQLGWIAMDSFFVLSGFLITGILVDTKLKPNYYRNYYVRRSIRIFPLYYVVLTLLTALALLREGGANYNLLTRNWGSPWWFFFYLGNFKTAFVGEWPHVRGYGPLWSLQIEEQFYLLFPIAVRMLSLKNLSRVLWTAVFLSPIFRVILFLWDPKNPFLQFVLLPCHMEGLALGALIAIRFRSGPWRVSKPLLTAAMIVLLTLTVLCSLNSVPLRVDEAWSSPFNRLAGLSLSAVACASLILWLIQFRGSIYTRWLTVGPMQFLGMISYGIYLLQNPARSIFDVYSKRIGWDVSPDSVLRFVILSALTIGVATVSWYAFERPLLRLKDRFTT
jgi:peptidoglycan/LPS O-acetylase OafA/YrhL